MKDLSIIVAENALASAKARGFNPLTSVVWEPFVEKSTAEHVFRTPGAVAVAHALIMQERKTPTSRGPSDPPAGGYYPGDKYSPPLKVARWVQDKSPGARTVTVSCYGCGRRVRMAETWIDLNGPAFQAYYCERCRPADAQVEPE